MNAGRTSIPSLAVAALPASLLLALRDRLAPASRARPHPAVPPPAGRAAPLTAAGFQGWFSLGDGGGEVGEDSVPAPLPHGLSQGLASMMDARLAVFVVLLWKCRLDESALDAVGGCRALKSVCLLSQPAWPFRLASCP